MITPPSLRVHGYTNALFFKSIDFGIAMQHELMNPAHTQQKVDEIRFCKGQKKENSFDIYRPSVSVRVFAYCIDIILYNSAFLWEKLRPCCTVCILHNFLHSTQHVLGRAVDISFSREFCCRGRHHFSGRWSQSEAPDIFDGSGL
jgi:hypothetical protein